MAGRTGWTGGTGGTWGSMAPLVPASPAYPALLPLHRQYDASPFRQVRRRLHHPSPPRRQSRHEHGLGSLRSRLADHVRLEHVHVPAVEVGRRHPLRTRASADREHGRLSHDHSRRVAVAAGAAPVDEMARRRRARRGDRAGRARRPDGAVLPAGRDLDARMPGSPRFSSA